jgi:CheY-like chemotaxis protein
MPRLLIVDDNAPIRYLMRFYLERTGYGVCGEAKGGVEGIEEAKRTQPDVILLDLTMPDMTGTETAAILKRVLPQIPIIVFTLHEDSVNEELAATMGVDLVVDKRPEFRNWRNQLGHYLDVPLQFRAPFLLDPSTPSPKIKRLIVRRRVPP